MTRGLYSARMASRKRGIAICAVAASAVALSPCSSSGRSAPHPASTTTPPVTASSQPAAPVPAKYQQLSAGLAKGLDAYQAMVDAMPAAPANAPAPVAAAELLPANGNRLHALLDPTTLPAVDQWLDRFRTIGIRGVTLGIKLPMLLPQLGPGGTAYTGFYRTVADHARARGMTVDVELGALFCGTVYARCSDSFHGSYPDFVTATVAQSRVVIDQVRPDYLTILAEPTTEAVLAGVGDFKTPAGSAHYVHDVLAGIGPRKSTKVGAGAASWLSPSYNQAILGESIDYLSLHTYPMNARIADTIAQDTALARSAHKPIMADEVGLYKTDGTEQSSPATADRIYRLDNFSFFEPLDVRFLTITAHWAKKAGALYVSPFWPGQLFAYLTWTPQLDTASYGALTQTSNQAVRRAFQARELTDLGRTWAGAF